MIAVESTKEVERVPHDGHARVERKVRLPKDRAREVRPSIDCRIKAVERIVVSWIRKRIRVTLQTRTAALGLNSIASSGNCSHRSLVPSVSQKRARVGKGIVNRQRIRMVLNVNYDEYGSPSGKRKSPHIPPNM